MLSRLRTFVNDLSSVFEKLDGERSNCPTCSGTGLLHCRKTWPWIRVVHSNNSRGQPCWFCEGVGSMPLYGLEGFFIGRASALFRTEDLKQPVDLPVKLHLCLGKYPETRCVLKSWKPSEKMKELLDVRLETTFWSLDAKQIPAVYLGYEDENSDQSLAGDDECHTSEVVSMFPSVLGSLDPSGIFGHHDFDIRGKESLVVQLPIHLESRCLRQKDPGKTAQRTTGLNRIKTKLRVAASVIFGTTRVADSSKSATSQQHSENGFLEDFEGPTGISGRTRSVRRNQIRVKAEREAAQRALWRKELKPLSSSEPSPIEPSGPAWSLSDSWKDLSSTWIAEETTNTRQSVESTKSEAEANLPAPSIQPEKQASFASLALGLPPISNLLSPVGPDKPR